MPDVQLALGPVVFQGFELPSNISFGGRQRLVVHQLAGGRRIIDCLGRDDSDISFSGVLSGPDASMRARVLDRLRADGGLLPLTWDVFFYTVTLREFRANYQNDAWIPYELKCTVMRDEADGLLQPIASTSELLAQSLASAAEYARGAGIDLSGVLAATSAPGATQYGTVANSFAVTSIEAGQMRLNTTIASVEAVTTQTDFGGTSAAGALNALSSGTAAAYQLAALAQARGFIGCAQADFSNGAV